MIFGLSANPGARPILLVGPSSRRGSKVRQRQVIGTVGSTGLATGPHVCFRVQKDGSYVNPARLRSGSRASIPEELMPTFAASRDMLLAELDGGAIVASRQTPEGADPRPE